MPEPFDLTTVIEDSISDASTPDVDTSYDAAPVDDSTSYDAPVEDTDAPTDDVPVDEGVDTNDISVASPAALQEQTDPASVLDKKLGIASHTNGRENRIPYSRVKKIVEGAERKALEPLQKQLAEIQPKVQQYEQRLEQVAQFEQVMLNEPQRFFDMLSTVPAYQGFFQMLSQLQSQAQGQAQQTQQTVDNDPMPGPDDAENGVYTMDGLNKLLDWQKRQAKKEVLSEVESKYEPIREEWEAQRRINALVPQVESQIREARTWEKFTENEDAIVQFLNANPNASLETAYRVVVTPHLRADREGMRKQLIQEIRTAPVSSSVGARSSRPAPQPTGPRSMEDVIREQVRNAGLR